MSDNEEARKVALASTLLRVFFTAAFRQLCSALIIQPLSNLFRSYKLFRRGEDMMIASEHDFRYCIVVMDAMEANGYCKFKASTWNSMIRLARL